MSASYFNLLKYAATGIASPDMSYYDKMRASTLMGGATVQTLTGIPPLSFKADGSPLISWSIKGNGQQTGTPTPVFVGVRTGNLWNEEYTNISPTIKYVPVYVGDGSFTLSTTTPYDSGVANLFLLSGNVSTGASTSANGAWRNHKVTAQSDSGYITIAYRHYSGTTSPTNCKTMLNSGSTALPYEPYGYKITITCADVTTPIYMDAPLRKALDGSYAVDVLSSAGTITREVDAEGNALATPTTQNVDVPEIQTVKGRNTLTVDTELQPSEMTITYKG